MACVIVSASENSNICRFWNQSEHYYNQQLIEQTTTSVPGHITSSRLSTTSHFTPGRDTTGTFRIIAKFTSLHYLAGFSELGVRRFEEAMTYASPNLRNNWLPNRFSNFTTKKLTKPKPNFENGRNHSFADRLARARKVQLLLREPLYSRLYYYCFYLSLYTSTRNL